MISFEIFYHFVHEICVKAYSFPLKVSRGLQSNYVLKNDGYGVKFVLKFQNNGQNRLTFGQKSCGLLSGENCS